MKKHYVMVIDTRRCIACSTCVVACKTENVVPLGVFRVWTTSEIEGSYPDLKAEHRSERCNHCAHASCVINCPTGASYYADDGTVQIDPARCTGCKDCLSACPYGARYINPRTNVAEKCTFCAHIDGTTACAQMCPTGSITFGDANDPESEVSRLIRENRLKVLKEGVGSKPQVYYIIN